jgi:hypothetical protein
VRAGLLQAEAATAGNSRLVFNVCFNYGGRWDIAQAAARLAARARPSPSRASTSAMALAHVPDPDLLIRTGGEKRISNFLLWQAAYAELYFSDKLWPEFDAAALDAAIADYAARAALRQDLAASAAGRPRRPPEAAAMLKQRVITAVVLLAILLPALFWRTPEPFLAVALVLIAAGGWEWGRLNGCGRASAVALWAWHAGAVRRLLGAGWVAQQACPAAVARRRHLWVLAGAALLRLGVPAGRHSARRSPGRRPAGLVLAWLAWRRRA